MTHAKDGTRLKDPDYLAWIRTKRCIFHPYKPAEPAHGKPWGKAMKGPDHCSLPLCRECHDQEHRHGRETVWKYVDRDALVESYNRQYCHETGTGLKELRGK